MSKEPRKKRTPRKTTGEKAHTFSVSVPKEVFDKAELRRRGLGYDQASEYVGFLIRQDLAKEPVHVRDLDFGVTASGPAPREMKPTAKPVVPANVVAGRFIQPQRRTGTISLPELGSIAAGDEDQMEELMKFADHHVDVPAFYQDLRAAFVLRVKGDSMNAAVPEPIFNGARVIMALRDPQDGEIIAALVDGKTTLKRFKIEDGKPVLISESTNPRHRNIIPLEGLEWKGVMVGRVES